MWCLLSTQEEDRTDNEISEMSDLGRRFCLNFTLVPDPHNPQMLLGVVCLAVCSGFCDSHAVLEYRKTTLQAACSRSAESRSPPQGQETI